MGASTWLTRRAQIQQMMRSRIEGTQLLQIGPHGLLLNNNNIKIFDLFVSFCFWQDCQRNLGQTSKSYTFYILGAQL